MDRAAWLEARWGGLAARLGAGERAAAAVRADLERRYREAHRHYHDARHVADCLQELDGVRALCTRPDVVELALWFHDAVYDPRRSDNEAASAALLAEAASYMGVARAVSDQAAAIVRATAGHAGGAPAAPDRDMMVALDIDLAILGRAPEEFERFERAVRAEYGFLGEEAWRKGRTNVLLALASRPRIFLTDELSARYEEPARRNLARSLERLAARSA